MIETLVFGAVAGGVLMWLRVRWLEAHAEQEALKVARGYGKISGRVMRQQGDGCPSAWPSSDTWLDEFNRGAREGWLECDREFRELEPWHITQGVT